MCSGCRDRVQDLRCELATLHDRALARADVDLGGAQLARPSVAVLARKIEEQAFRLHAAACHQQGLCELRPQRGEAFEQLGTVLEAHGPGDFFQCPEDGALHSGDPQILRSEEHTSELQSLMRSSYAVICLKKKII